VGLRLFADDLYVHEGNLRFYGFRLQTRMAVIRLSGHRLLVYSPTALSDRLAHDLSALGRVAYLVAPNKIHNRALADWGGRYPDAALYAPSGLRERRPDLSVLAVLGDEAPTVWGEEVELTVTAGNVFFSEALLYHRRSRTLLVGDLIENLDRSTASPLGLAVARLFGVGPGPSPSPEFRLYTDDADAATGPFARAVAWDPQRIFLCHGRPITDDAGAVLRAVTTTILRGAHRRPAAVRWLLRRVAALQ
jgi:hypothetical protein